MCSTIDSIQMPPHKTMHMCMWQEVYIYWLKLLVLEYTSSADKKNIVVRGDKIFHPSI